MAKRNTAASIDKDDTVRPNPRVASPSGTLARGLAIMDVLLASSQPLSLMEIAARVRLDQSTILRILRVLESEAQVLRLADGKRYMPSPKALRPLPLLHPLEQLRREAAPMLRDMAVRISQTVVLVVYFGLQRVVLDVLQVHGSLSPYYESWLRGPLHASGPGKALLLSMPAQKRREVLGSEPYKAYTEHTLCTWRDFQRNMEEAATLGVISVCDEFYDGLTAMAANFHNDQGRALGCIVVTGHSADLDASERIRVARELANCARLMPFQAASLRQLEQLAGA
ncbi:IclR family transcriptional regulator [Allopusillimonas soli]|uniref:Helix-turn-helix domain-containing protein n=1 Tax=Allopusillimonas soli TaxID=659016 RepID=A0A853FAR8_9BURK|nr:IclR family transcriptional regulator C-terminal domain-containing protein [Allopusillimonas soli]NYT36020.1 helix-turn-helix domain-containing protein [Allopusillimonas soli]TEA76363.1 IclR family transcriptional regulator [Allopusillimonas soli]